MSETIVAIATAFGEGGIGIVKLSGPNSEEILRRIFRRPSEESPSSRGEPNHARERASGRFPSRTPQDTSPQGEVDCNEIYWAKYENRYLMYGHIVDVDAVTDVISDFVEMTDNVDAGEIPVFTGMTNSIDVAPTIIDEVMACVMRGPRSYTGEDVVEIYTHGGVVPLKRTLELCIRHGARLAEKGEFTKLAFLNGRIDLTQADAVIDLIKAKTEVSFDNAYRQHEGLLSESISKVRDSIAHVLSTVLVNLDYPDLDGANEVVSGVNGDICEIKSLLEKLSEGASSARMIRDGINVAIVGKPNVGKSSLLNALLKESRAIVTDIAGTTRDVIEEYLDIRGLPVVLRDTAGIRSTGDEIELIGIDKAIDSIKTADMILHIMDVTELDIARFADVLESEKEKLSLQESVNNSGELHIQEEISEDTEENSCEWFESGDVFTNVKDVSSVSSVSSVSDSDLYIASRVIENAPSDAKIVVLLNKVDLLEQGDGVAESIGYAHDEESNLEKDNANDKSYDKSSDETNEKTNDNANDKRYDKNTDETNDKRYDKTNDNANDNANDKRYDKSSDETNDKRYDKTNDKTNDNANDKSNNNDSDSDIDTNSNYDRVERAIQAVLKMYPQIEQGDVLAISALRGAGLSEFEDKIEELVGLGELTQRNSVLLTNARHVASVNRAIVEIDEALHVLDDESFDGLDFVQMNLQTAYEELGLIIGDSVTEDILDEVFSRFCIGK
ncbi:MAG: tRNA uridine-5-carboxymethylaminomethyl(34) synthesis GTPase MnmE [Clostridiales Family XIII bacterium]|jgi:tRNA U34 5-carboxymethylaminomethyl modifying GTPase MnmE/TrmE|nr:tRNA uridine-5-carboxymethylaminomethyl(34) synthesis GTPase MnmE [Clostridiales Family XIII bacterium]